MDKTLDEPGQASVSQTFQRKAPSHASASRAQKLVTMGGVAGAVAASSCCIAPFVLFALSVSGAWIGNLTRLAPYHPYFVALTLACIGYGYRLVYRARTAACADGAVCARPLPNRIVIVGLVLATVLVVAAMAFDFLAPLLLV